MFCGHQDKTALQVCERENFYVLAYVVNELPAGKCARKIIAIHLLLATINGVSPFFDASGYECDDECGHLCQGDCGSFC